MPAGPIRTGIAVEKKPAIYVSQNLILTDEATFPGCQIDCHLIRVIKAQQPQEGKQSRNDRLITAAEASGPYFGVRDSRLAVESATAKLNGPLCAAASARGNTLIQLG